MLLNLVHCQFGCSKAGTYSEHRMFNTICDGSLDQQLMSADLSLAWQPQAPFV